MGLGVTSQALEGLGLRRAVLQHQPRISHRLDPPMERIGPGQSPLEVPDRDLHA